MPEEAQTFELSTDEDETASFEFRLSSTPTEVHHQFVREVIDRTLGKRRRKQPYQCVTVKLPYRTTHA